MEVFDLTSTRSGSDGSLRPHIDEVRIGRLHFNSAASALTRPAKPRSPLSPCGRGAGGEAGGETCRRQSSSLAPPIGNLTHLFRSCPHQTSPSCEELSASANG